MNGKEILVYADTWEMPSPLLLGILTATQVRGKEIFTFEYSADWLKYTKAFPIDPELQLYSGRHFTHGEKVNFGIFTDSAPDRWGRTLMDRRASIKARISNELLPRLLESDYLLGVYDGHRMGALRFKLEGSGPFLNDDKTLSAPPFSSLRELEVAAENVELDADESDNERLKWINMLMAPGSSLGGARPKASVVDTNGNLWIAKFPSKNDGYDVEAWEMVVHMLAKNAGLNVAESRAQKFASKRYTFLTKRFDRASDGRIHFASAMTLLGYSDGTDASMGANYLELAEFIIKNGINPDADLRELWTRIVFSICVKNTDDHLRNHGFLLQKRGWALSPAYDITPNPKGTCLTLNINESDNSLSLDLARSVAEYFRVENDDAKNIINSIKNVVSNWCKYASEMKISRSEQEYYSNAFIAK